MNKKALTEQDIRSKFISPSIQAAGWDMLRQACEEVQLTRGRVIVKGKLSTRAEAKRADYDPEYFYLWLQSPEFTRAIDPGRSNGMPHISTKQVERIPFLPPSVADQRRIVAKVIELRSLFDALEARLTRGREKSTHLIASMVHRLTAA